jgi:hypothetical protein
MRIKRSMLSIGKVQCSVIQFNYTPPNDEKIINIMCEGKTILYLTRQGIRLEQDSLATSLANSFNKFYIISTSDEEFEFKINEDIIHSSKLKSVLTSLDIKSLQYAVAYEQYLKGNAVEAIDILNYSLKDKYLTRLVLNAFTAKEREKSTEILLKAAHNKKVQLQPRRWINARLVEGLIGDNSVVDEGPCFMDILEIFEKNGDKFLPKPSEEYKRIGRKIVDNYNAFKCDKSVELAADFRKLVFSKEKLNISVRYEIPGFVKINPRQAKAAGFKTNIFSAKIFREQTIIKDGDINIDKFRALVSKDTLNYLRELKIKGLFRLVDSNYPMHDNFTSVEINISRIPVLSRSYVLKYDNLDFVLDTCYNQRVAECKQKVIKYFIEKCSKNTKAKEAGYTNKQYELLNSYGLDFKGVYHGIDNKVLNEDGKQYEYRIFEFALKGFSTLSKVENLLIKMRDSKNKLNKPDRIMADFAEYLIESKLYNNINKLNKLLQEQKTIIRTNTRILAQVKLAKTLTGGWWKELKSGAGNNYLYEKEDKMLIVKVMRKNVEI